MSKVALITGGARRVGAGTLARDLKLLESHGLRVEGLSPWEFFPRTHHVEVLALLSRH